MAEEESIEVGPVIGPKDAERIGDIFVEARKKKRQVLERDAYLARRNKKGSCKTCGGGGRVFDAKTGGTKPCQDMQCKIKRRMTP